MSIKVVGNFWVNIPGNQNPANELIKYVQNPRPRVYNDGPFWAVDYDKRKGNPRFLCPEYGIEFYCNSWDEVLKYIKRIDNKPNWFQVITPAENHPYLKNSQLEHLMRFKIPYGERFALVLRSKLSGWTEKDCFLSDSIYQLLATYWFAVAYSSKLEGAIIQCREQQIVTFLACSGESNLAI